MAVENKNETNNKPDSLYDLVKDGPHQPVRFPWPNLPERIVTNLKNQYEILGYHKCEPNEDVHCIPLPKPRELCINTIFDHYESDCTHICQEDTDLLEVYHTGIDLIRAFFVSEITDFIILPGEEIQDYKLQERYDVYEKDNHWQVVRKCDFKWEECEKIMALNEDEDWERYTDPCEIYGAEHLIRLFGEKMDEFLLFRIKFWKECNKISDKCETTFKLVSDDFLIWLSKQKGYLQYCETNDKKEKNKMIKLKYKMWDEYFYCLCGTGLPQESSSSPGTAIHKWISECN